MIIPATGWATETQARLKQWADHVMAHGSDSFTAQRRALAMLHHDTVSQAQVLAYVDDFRLLAILFSIIPLFLPLMRRIHVERPRRARSPTPPPRDACRPCPRPSTDTPARTGRGIRPSPQGASAVSIQRR